jgi:hypothetical protein
MPLKEVIGGVLAGGAMATGRRGRCSCAQSGACTDSRLAMIAARRHGITTSTGRREELRR